MDEPTTPPPERVESHYRARLTWVFLSLLVLASYSIWNSSTHLLTDRVPGDGEQQSLHLFLLVISIVVLASVLSGRRGYRVVIDHQGINGLSWPTWSLPWSQIARVERTVARDQGLLSVYRHGHQRPKIVRLKLSDLDAAYALASAMTARTPG